MIDPQDPILDDDAGVPEAQAEQDEADVAEGDDLDDEDGEAVAEDEAQSEA